MSGTPPTLALSSNADKAGCTDGIGRNQSLEPLTDLVGEMLSSKDLPTVGAMFPYRRGRLSLFCPTGDRQRGNAETGDLGGDIPHPTALRGLSR